MPIDERIANKSSEEMTKEDVGGLMKSPPEHERPLVELGAFEQQPKPPIYKNIPLKFVASQCLCPHRDNSSDAVLFR